MKKRLKIINGKVESPKDIKAVLREDARKLSRKELIELAEQEKENLKLDQDDE